MVVRDVAYIDVYAKDKLSTVDRLAATLGFTRLVDSVGVDRSSVLLRLGTAHLLITSGPACWKYLDRHGDGVADIALVCDDVAATLDSALAAGAVLADVMGGNPVISGFGGIRHTLLPLPRGSRTGLPSGRRWATDPASPPPTVRGRRERHRPQRVEIVVEGDRLTEHEGFYRDAFAFSPDGAARSGPGGPPVGSRVVRSASGDVTFSLVAPGPGEDPRPGGPAAFLAAHGGPGVRQLTFPVAGPAPVTHVFHGRAMAHQSAVAP
ncbi:4-hydroxyphenylpyruvate dioxygenase [Streptomyces sp. RLB1-33]|nr:4-hydroxyphenylpyruvate dioxygenase [Streptomyces sp. RLB1-33]QIY68664.1 4-hydroxyphenylpyruvate dioxygenase [Streptomyces sp. RLB1-33]